MLRGARADEAEPHFIVRSQCISAQVQHHLDMSLPLLTLQLYCMLRAGYVVVLFVASRLCWQWTSATPMPYADALCLRITGREPDRRLAVCAAGCLHVGLCMDGGLGF